MALVAMEKQQIIDPEQPGRIRFEAEGTRPADVLRPRQLDENDAGGKPDSHRFFARDREAVLRLQEPELLAGDRQETEMSFLRRLDVAGNRQDLFRHIEDRLVSPHVFRRARSQKELQAVPELLLLAHPRGIVHPGITVEEILAESAQIICRFEEVVRESIRIAPCSQRGQRLLQTIHELLERITDWLLQQSDSEIAALAWFVYKMLPAG